MKQTGYAPLSSRELVELAICRDTSTELEIELARRLDLCLDIIEESEELDDS